MKNKYNISILLILILSSVSSICQVPEYSMKNFTFDTSSVKNANDFITKRNIKLDAKESRKLVAQLKASDIDFFDYFFREWFFRKIS